MRPAGKSRPAALTISFVLLAASLLAAAHLVADTPRIGRFALSRLEAQMDATFASAPDPFYIEGNTRGIYLDGYGAVFTNMVDLAPTPIPNPFHQLTLKDTLAIHDSKARQVSALRGKIRQTLLMMAASPALDSVRPTEQMVCGVTLFYYRWEDTTGLPRQIVMQAEKGKLLDLQSNRTPKSQLDSIIKVQEL